MSNAPVPFLAAPPVAVSYLPRIRRISRRLVVVCQGLLVALPRALLWHWATASEAELAVYGIFELQELERVLRGKDARAMREVADTIRAKIGRPVAEEDDVFLLSYYRQLKARLERKLLFGKRREDKYASD